MKLTELRRRHALPDDELHVDRLAAEAETAEKRAAYNAGWISNEHSKRPSFAVTGVTTDESVHDFGRVEIKVSCHPGDLSALEEFIEQQMSIVLRGQPLNQAEVMSMIHEHLLLLGRNKQLVKIEDGRWTYHPLGGVPENPMPPPEQRPAVRRKRIWDNRR